MEKIVHRAALMVSDLTGNDEMEAWNKAYAMAAFHHSHECTNPLKTLSLVLLSEVEMSFSVKFVCEGWGR